MQNGRLPWAVRACALTGIDEIAWWPDKMDRRSIVEVINETCGSRYID